MLPSALWPTHELAPTLDSWQSALECLAFPVWLLDSQTKELVWANPAAVRLYLASTAATKYSLAQALSRSSWQQWKTLAEQLELGQSHIEACWFYQQQRLLELPCQFSPLRLADGRVYLLVQALQLPDLDLNCSCHSHSNDTELRLRQALLEQQVILDNSVLGIVFLSQRRIQRCNARFAEIYGYTQEELIGRYSEMLYESPSSYRMLGETAYPLLSNGLTYRGEHRMSHRDGRPLWCSLTGCAIDQANPDSDSIWIIEDITERKQAEVRLCQTLHEHELILDNAIVGIVFLKDRRVLRCNRRFESLFGYRRGELDHQPSSLWYPDLATWEAVGKRGYAKLARGETFQEEMLLKRKDGSLFWCDVISQAIDPLDPAQGSVWITLDITERKRAEEALRQAQTDLEQRVAERTRELSLAVRDLNAEINERKYAEARAWQLAHHDTLTGLPNRTLLYARLEQAVADAHRHRQHLGLLFLDLDRFKTINDSLGHTIGDGLLRATAARLRRCVAENDTVARLGGDEFVILLKELEKPQDASVTAQRIERALAGVFVIDGHELHISPSIGISIYPNDGHDPATLMRNADTAMYQAKEAGRANYQFFTAQMNARAIERLSLENSLRRALQNEEFELHFQPRITLSTQRLTGAEVLLRWRHPERGLIGPDTFIPIAEETGLINAIGEWVLRQACAHNRRWQQQGYPALVLAVNLSAVQFRRHDLVKSIQQILLQQQLEPRYLELELTESMLMRNAQDIVRMLGQLNDMGIRLSVDDFGTGYSNLAYLKRFPLDILKIDRSFVQELPENAEDAAIAKTIIAVAHSLGLTVVAEGVERAAQVAWLLRHGCDEYQGYYFSRPLAAADFERLLRQHSDGPGWLSPRGDT